MDRYSVDSHRRYIAYDVQGLGANANPYLMLFLASLILLWGFIP
jgi:hypothetical protein